MGTYIIHFDDKPWQDLDDELYYRCKEIPWFSTTKTTISRLTPYTEDSAYAHGYTEAESKYREIRDELEKQAYQRGYETGYEDGYDEPGKNQQEAYQRGLNDAWEVARKVTQVRKYGGYGDCLEEVFGRHRVPWDVFDYSASEAIEKIRQYEQEKEEQIQVGDEVKCIEGNWTAVVTRNEEGYLTLMGDNGGIANGYDAKRFTKTGRHFPEIAEVLRKMKEANNG